tara:strand:- start:52 stop:726 length:675 start_codon:yes stop_codon:yes gene_type:complete
MTFSLVARCEETGMLGTAVASSSPAVAARCSYTRSNVGAVSSQNVTDPTLGILTLNLLEKGLSAIEAIDHIKTNTNYLDYRQILIIDSKGQTAIHSGSNSLGIWSDAKGKNVLSAGNLLANSEVPKAIVENYQNSSGNLGDRLIASLQGGLEAGGEAGPIHSAGMKISDKVSWPIIDLRCDWSEDSPINKLSEAWNVYKPQVNDYLQRALDPTKSPSYGVPGDK